MKHVILFLFLSIGTSLYSQDMNNLKMDSILHAITDSIQGGDGVWEIGIEDRKMLIITDENHNRMRIISPIQEVRSLPQEEFEKALIANFHSALDAKYAISDDILWATFIHRLRELTEDQFLDAIRQVYNAANTFGTSYNSTELEFPSSDDNENERINQKPKKKVKKI